MHSISVISSYRRFVVDTLTVASSMALVALGECCEDPVGGVDILCIALELWASDSPMGCMHKGRQLRMPDGSDVHVVFKGCHLADDECLDRLCSSDSFLIRITVTGR